MPFSVKAAFSLLIVIWLMFMNTKMKTEQHKIMGRVLRYLADLNVSDWIKGDDPGSIDMRQRSKNLQKILFSELYLKGQQ